MKELVVISGKGGSGKTSIVASFAALARNAVVADCDVDAADLHLVLDPKIVETHEFSGGSRARINPERCTACGKCAEVCRFDALRFDGPAANGREKTWRVDPIACEGCAVCAWFCPEDAVEFGPVVNGEWYVSTTRHGPMVHARLGVAEENSGKLVTTVRREAGKVADREGLELILVDGSPGIGCPVIASITGADVVLIVTEPTLSGLHDLGRVAELTTRFHIPILVLINKWDLNPEMTEKIEREVVSRKSKIAGRVRYDNAVTKAQILKHSVVEIQGNGSAEDIRGIWEMVREEIDAIPSKKSSAHE